PIPFVQPSLTKATVGPPRKLAFGIGLTNELEEASPDSAAQILARLLGESAAKAIDQYVFDNVAADSTRPPGLLNGVTPLTASTTGASTIDAMTADVGTFANAFGAAGINAESMILITNPREGLSARMLSGFEATPTLPILMTPSVPSGTVIPAIPAALASGFAGVPEVEMSTQWEVLFEDTSPTAVPGVGPTRSLFQQAMIGVKVRVKCAWASLQPGAVQFMTSVKW